MFSQGHSRSFELNGEEEPVWLTPYLRDPQPEGERERDSRSSQTYWHVCPAAFGCYVVDVAGTTLPVSSQLKSLGVIIDSHMRFDTHVGAVVRACNCHTHALRRVRKHPTTETASRHESTILKLTAVWWSCCSRRESTKQRRPGHVSAAHTVYVTEPHCY